MLRSKDFEHRKEFGRSAARTVMPLLAAVACFVGGRAVGAGNTYYVAPTGSDSSSGSAAAPFQTLQKGASVLQAGDTLVVRAGNYKGFVVGYDSTGTYGPIAGTAGAPITIQADP